MPYLCLGNRLLKHFLRSSRFLGYNFQISVHLRHPRIVLGFIPLTVMGITPSGNGEKLILLFHHFHARYTTVCSRRRLYLTRKYPTKRSLSRTRLPYYCQRSSLWQTETYTIEYCIPSVSE